ncbi:MAG: type I glutamate--ammonia ligase [Planctomycetaceae bacterium]|nr:type I glutamate--ammonia ligase [Planctomycetaceae bacterium]MCP4812967.1 type I glutamate--ammonia ligase [Planctomycetaceae bacterium]MEC9002027.1 type I glutamate--ammonia ligase [Planctomycetota bacterium]
MTPKEVLAFCREKDVRAVDLRFVDFLGAWQHTTIPVAQLTEDLFESGLGFDGSSIRGWQTINESDMLIIPQAETTFLDPFAALPTVNVICDIQDPITGEDYSRDPRNVARKAVNYLKSSGIADTAYFGPEAEFFIFDDVRYDQNAHEGYYHVDSVEGEWNRGRQENPNLGNKVRHKEGYFPVPPVDQMMDIRNEMMQTLIDCGLTVECQHHEVGTAGQSEIDLKYQEMILMADQMMIYKYIVKNVAYRHQKTVTFMPKPIFTDNGSGMHTHLSLWKDGEPLFAGSEYAGLSEMALHAIGGILRHAAAILAFTNPTTNSYKRLVPGYEAPVNLAYSQRNRSAACRIPMYSSSPKAKRVEFRCPDPSCNPYLAFSALLMAAIDGIQNKINPGDPLDKDIYDLPPEETVAVSTTPASLGEALEALEADHEFLLRGDVFTTDVLQNWITYKHENEVDAIRLRPHPHEFCMYYDV